MTAIRWAPLAGDEGDAKVVLMWANATGLIPVARKRLPAGLTDNEISYDLMATQLSRAAYDRLQAEFEDLTTRGRIEVANKIETARLLGDLSENGDYHAAKDEQGHMEGRIRQLEHLLETSEIIEPVGDGVIGAGSVVTIVYEGDGDDMAERYLIGHHEERTGDLDVMSPNSPLGGALLGHVVGDVVAYQAPNGELRVAVRAVDQP